MDSNRAFSRDEKAQAILVVDDDTQVLKFLSRMLGAMGYEPVYQATSAQEALDIWKLHKQSIQLVVSDFVMPEVSGDNLALRLKNEQPHVNVLFISGNDPDSLQSSIPLVLGRNFLQKPFTIADVRKTVATLNSPESPETAFHYS